MRDPCRLRPSELCRLLNSTPLGEVITERQLKRQRVQAGLRIGDGQRVDLLRYVAWLIQIRHAPPVPAADAGRGASDLVEAAQGAAAVARRRLSLKGHGQKLTRKQEALIAALLTEPTYAAAADKAGVGTATLYRWLNVPAFRTAYRQARREAVESAIARSQAGSGQAVETLLDVSRNGRRDSDRVRASIAVMNYSLGGLREADTLHGEPTQGEDAAMDRNDLVQFLAARLRQIDAAELSTVEKSRVTALLTDALLRAQGDRALVQQLEGLQAALDAIQNTQAGR